MGQAVQQRSIRTERHEAAGESPRLPALTVIPGTAAPGTADATAPAMRGAFPIRATRRLRGVLDRIIGRFSLVSNDAVLDIRDFAWTCALRANWQAIRDEMLASVPAGGETARTPGRRRRSFFLWGHGRSIEENAARCPVTASVLRQIPGLNSALFSVLAAGAHIPVRRGATKGLLTCHLGLVVPRDGDVRMRVRDRVVRWAEGETLLFDDTYDHEVWNETDGTRAVLLIQVRRPLRQPGKWIVGALLGAARRSAFAREGA